MPQQGVSRPVDPCGKRDGSAGIGVDFGNQALVRRQNRLRVCIGRDAKQRGRLCRGHP